jgi:hypothetical protein
VYLIEIHQPMAGITTKQYLPLWTKRAVLDGSGRDPLGLSRVSDNFTDLLLPSIITTTNRARYYSFYPWALRESCDATEKDSDSADFAEEFRKHDAAFAIASELGKQTKLSIVGIDQVNKHLGEVSGNETISTVFRVLPANNLGGFGQYYGGCLQSLGLGRWEEDGRWHVSALRGRKLANAFAASVSSTPYAQNNCGRLPQVPLNLLRASSAKFSLDGIREDAAKNERELLAQILFDLDEDADPSGPGHRQATLGQLLHVLEAYEEIGGPPARNAVSDSCLYWPHYYGCLYGPDDVSVPYVAHSSFTETSAYWRQFCVHQFFSYAAEEVLQAILDAVSTSADGLTKGELVKAMISTNFIDELEEATERSLPGPAALMKYFRSGDAPESAQRQFSANHNLAEWWIYSGDSEVSLATRLGCAFAILTQLHAKWRASEDAALWDVAEKAGREWWVGTCFEWGDQWLEKQPDWETAIELLIDEVHSRHELVRFQKHRLDATWLEKTGDYYTKLQDLTPELRANRHPNAATILQDLCILKDGTPEDPLLLTAWGRTALKDIVASRS